MLSLEYFKPEAFITLRIPLQYNRGLGWLCSSLQSYCYCSELLYLHFHCLWQLANGDRWKVPFLLCGIRHLLAASLRLPLSRKDWRLLPTPCHAVTDICGAFSLWKTFFGGSSLTRLRCCPYCWLFSSALRRLCLLVPIHWALRTLCIYMEFIQASRFMNVNLNMSLNLKVLDQNTLKLCLDLKSASRVQFCKWTLFFLCGKTNQRLKSGLAFECHKVLPSLEMNLFLKHTP